MTTYRIGVKELHTYFIEVQADTEKDANNKVIDGKGNEIDSSIEDLNPNEWTIETPNLT